MKITVDHERLATGLSLFTQSDKEATLCRCSLEKHTCLSFVSGPQSIGARTNDEPLEAGVFVSDGTYFM